MEIIPLITKTASECADAVENNWVCQYPRPEKCVFDNGSELTTKFTDMLQKHRSRSYNNEQLIRSLLQSVHV